MTRRLFVSLVLLAGLAAHAQSRIPLSDLGGGSYLGFTGGLYENGLDVPPPDHFAAGLAAAAEVRPINGKIVMLSIGMSNTTQEFCAANNPAPCTSWSFVGQALADPSVNHSTLALVNGARGGQAADAWDSPLEENYRRIRDMNLTPAGLSEEQVQVAWVKLANRQPAVALPSPNADAYRLRDQLDATIRAMKQHYPNLRLVYLSSRIYAGYATTALNPEPYAYESAFAVKWVIQQQIDRRRAGSVESPWIGWGPYLWADGLSPRSDGLIWERRDLDNDGTHPSQSGERKVGTMLLDFLKNEPTARPWFLENPPRKRRAVAR